MHHEYQEEAMRTMPSLSPEHLPNWALGLCGAVAELQEDIEAGADVVDHVGNVLWYCHAMLTCLKVPADVVLIDLVAATYDPLSAGRIAEIVRKHVFRFRPLDRVRLLSEIRAVAAGCVLLLGSVPLEECYRRNVVRLWQRYPDGFIA